MTFTAHWVEISVLFAVRPIVSELHVTDHFGWVIIGDVVLDHSIFIFLTQILIWSSRGLQKEFKRSSRGLQEVFKRSLGGL